MKFKLNASPFAKALLIGFLALSVSACHEDHEDALIVPDEPVVTPPTNTAPVIDSTSVDTVEEGSVYSYTLTASDAEGDALTLTASTLPAWLTFDAASGLLTGTPADTDVGDHAVTIEVSDGTLSASQSFTITVTALVVEPTIELGPELLTNGGFEEGSGDWTGADGLIVTVDGNSYFEVDVLSAGNVFDVNLSQSMTLVPDSDYVVSFRAKTSTVTATALSINPISTKTSVARTMLVGLGLFHDPWTNITESVALTDEWQTFTFTITTTGFGDDDSRVLFDMGGEVGVVSIDDVTVKAVIAEDGDTGGDDTAGTELLINGDFEDGATAWTGADTSIVVDGDNSFFEVDVVTAGNVFDVNLSQSMTLIPDTAYLVSFKAKASVARTMLAGLGLFHDPWTNITETVNLTTEWQTFTYTITTTGFGDDDSRVLFDMGGEVGVVSIDDVSVKLAVAPDDDMSGDDTAGPELLINGDFEDGITAWTLPGDDPETIVTDGDNSFFQVDVVTAGNPWDVNLSQVMTLIPNTNYVLTFRAKASVARTMIVGAGLNEDPWHSAVVSVDLTTEWQTFTVAGPTVNNDDGTPFGGDNSRVLFDMGSEIGVVSIDDVSVKLAVAPDDDTGGDDTAGPELLTNGDFESGFASWTGADTSIVTEGGNTFFEVDVVTAGNVFDVNLSQSMTLIPDTAYLVSFKAKASVARTMLAGLGLFHDPWTNIAETVNLTTEWQTFTYTITTTGFGDDDSRVLFDMGGEVGVVSIDDVSVKLAATSDDDTGGDTGGGDTGGGDTGGGDTGGGDTGGGDTGGGDTAAPELLINGDFENGAADWTGADTSIVVEGGNTFFEVDVVTAGNVFDVNLSQTMTLIPDTAYVLSFRAKASVARTMLAGLGLFHDPWTNVVETVNLTTEWQSFTYTITTTGFGDDNSRVLFDMGGEVGVVSIDDVSVTLAVVTGDDTGETGMVVNFEADGAGAAYTWTVFENDDNPALEIVANPDASGLNTSATVAKFTARQTGNPWAGTETAHGDFGPMTLDASNSIIKIMVYKTVISDVGIKFAIASGGAQPEIKVANTLVNQWEELTFDFSGNIGLVESIDIDQVIVFPDFDLDGRTSDTVSYFDNITFSGSDAGGDTGGDAGVELLTNGDFEEGATAWTGADNSIVVEAGNTFFEVDVVTAGNVFDVNLSQSMTLIPDTTYVLMFKAKASVARTMLAGLGLFHDPWTNVTESVALTTEWQTFTFTITTTGFGDDDSRVLFDMGGETGIVSIDDVSVVVQSGGDTGGGDDTSGPIAPVDFEAGGAGAGYTWAVFENDDNPALEIVANPDTSGLNTSATVAQFTARQTGNPWAGTESAHGDFGPMTLDASNSIIKIMVYKSVISDVGVKFAIASGGAQPEIKVANTLVNQWEELTFDFSGNIGLVESINIDQVIVFPDFNLDGRTSDTVNYFDNITFGSN